MLPDFATKLRFQNLQSEIFNLNSLDPACFSPRELEFMRLHIHFLSSKADSLSFQPKTLFQSVVTA